MINNFIQDICDILNIEVPTVSFDTSTFSSDTMMAQCSPDGKIIYLKRHAKPNPDQLFSIVHELRHIWQMKNDRNLYFSTYKPVNLISSVDEYNNQIAEIDANAFAGLIMISFFHIRPLFHGVSDDVKSKIYDRMTQLEAIYCTT